MPVPSVNHAPTVRLSTQASRDHGHSWPQRRDDERSGRKRLAADPRDRAAPWPVRPIKPMIRHDRRRAIALHPHTDTASRHDRAAGPTPAWPAWGTPIARPGCWDAGPRR
jgi:hypothetical protein